MSEGGPHVNVQSELGARTYTDKSVRVPRSNFFSFFLFKNTFFVIKDLATKCLFISVCITHTPSKLGLFLVLWLKVIWLSSGEAGSQFNEQSD